MPGVIAGLATARPRHSIAQHEAAELAKMRCCQTQEQHALLPLLYRRARVEQRGSVLLEERTNGSGPRQSFFPPASGTEDAGPTTLERMQRYAAEAPALAAEASLQALQDAAIAPARIAQLVTVSCTGFVAPGVDVTLIKRLGLPATIGRTHVGFMGCHGALNGLRVASSFLGADPSACVLMTALELCSLHFSYGWDPERMVANALFADGAAAVVLAGDEPTASSPWRLAANGSCLFPDSEHDMSWQIGNHGFDMRLSARVPSLISAHLRPWLEEWLARQHMTLAGVRSWAVHPGGPRILDAVRSCLDLPTQALAVSRDILSECGNMSSPTILFILQRLRQLDAPRPCVALGFGPGLAAEAALFA